MKHINQLIYDFEISLRKENKLNSSTINLYKKKLNDFSKNFNANIKIDEIRKKDLDKFLLKIRNQNYSIQTYNLYISAIKVFYKYLNMKFDLDDYGKLIKNRKKIETCAISTDKIEAFLSLIKDLDDFRKTAFLMYIVLGLKADVISKLKKDDVIFEEDKIGICLNKDYKTEILYYDLLSNKYGLRLKRELLELMKKSDLYIFENSKSLPITSASFIYFFKKIKDELSFKVASILQLRSEALLLKKEIELACDLKKMIHRRYKLLRLIKEGENSKVYLAKDLKRNIPVAFKLLLRVNDNPENIINFKNEFSIVKKLNHPLIANIYDFGYLNDIKKFYYTMEYIDYKPLEKLASKISVSNACAILNGLLSFLKYMRQNKLLHYDLNTRNILCRIRENDNIDLKVVDFGMASTPNEATVKGSSKFIAPEILIHKKSDLSSDIFSVGVVIYYLLTKKFPFATSNFQVYFNDIKNNKLVDLFRHNESVSLEFNKIIMKMIALNVNKRYCEPEEIQKDLSKFIDQNLLLNRDLSSKINIRYPNFVGRNHELDILKNNFNIIFSPSLKQADISINLISGESGIGKSAIIDEMKNYANLSEINFLELNLGQEDPYLSVLKFVSAFSKLKQKQLKISPYAASALKSSALAKLSEYLYKIVSKSKAILVIKNSEYISKDLIIFFKFFLENFSNLKYSLFIIFSFNSDRKKSNQLFDLINSKVPEYSRVNEINLSPLSKEECSKLLFSILNRPPGDDFLNYIYDICGGNPGLIMALVPYLHEKALLFIKEFSVSLKSKPGLLPSNILETISDRLKSLNPLQRQILYLLALDEFTLNVNLIYSILFYTTYELTRLEISLNVENLIRRNYIYLKSPITSASANKNAKRSEDAELAFTSRFVKDNIKKFLLQKEARSLHKSIALFIDDTSILDNKNKERLAYHLLLANDKAEAINYYKEIADENYESGYVFKAAKIYDIILNSLRPLDTRKKEELAKEILIRLGNLHLKLAEYKKATEYLQAAITGASTKEKIEIKKSFSQMKINQGFLEEGIKDIDEVIIISKEEAYKDIFIEANILKASALLGLAKYNEVSLLLKNILSTKVLEDKYKSKLYNLAGLLDYYNNKLDCSLKNFKLSCDYATKLKDLHAISNAYNNIGLIHYQLSEFEDAIKYYNESLQISNKTSDILARAQEYSNIGSCYLKLGKLGDALKTYLKSYNILLNLDMPRETDSIAFNIGLIYSELGDYEKSEQFRQTSLSLARDRSNNLLIAYNESLSGELFYNMCEYEKAIASYKKAFDLFANLGNNRVHAEILISLAACENQLGNLEASESYILAVLKIGGDDLKTKIEANILSARIALSRSNHSYCKSILDEIEEIEMSKLHYLTKLLYFEIFTRFYLSIGDIRKSKKSGKQLEKILYTIKANIPESKKANFLKNPRIQIASEVLFQLKLAADGLSDRNKLKCLIDINWELSSETDIHRLGNMVLDNAILFNQAKRGFVLLKNKQSFDVLVARNFKKTDIDDCINVISSTVFKATLDHDMIINIQDAFMEFENSESIQKANLKSILSFPIVENNKLIGAVYLDDPTKVGAFAHVDTEILSCFARQVSIAISNSKYIETIKNKKEKIEKMASELEQRLLITDKNYDIANESFIKKSRDEKIKYDYQNIITKSPMMFELFDIIEKVKDADVSVLITGESGVGKELIARAIHFGGNRKDKAFFAENCGAITETILESELFGYVKGAFTDAIRDKRGIFELANEGSIFLDEIGEMSLSMQKKLLRVLQNKTIRRVGGNKYLTIDIRVICATNRNLSEMMKNEKFREDLYYRINVIEINVPALRERKEDIPLLVDYFLKKHARGKPKKFTSSLINLFQNYNWPGNVRELENEVTKLITLSTSDTITPEFLLEKQKFVSFNENTQALSLTEIEQKAIKKAYHLANYNKTKTAKILGINIKTLYSKLHKYKIS
ncbi:MAG: sigma 54-interacting transcriptional regulator [Pseudomonadota bacterium]